MGAISCTDSAPSNTKRQHVPRPNKRLAQWYSQHSVAGSLSSHCICGHTSCGERSSLGIRGLEAITVRCASKKGNGSRRNSFRLSGNKVRHRCRRQTTIQKLSRRGDWNILLQLQQFVFAKFVTSHSFVSLSLNDITLYPIPEKCLLWFLMALLQSLI